MAPLWQVAQLDFAGLFFSPAWGFFHPLVRVAQKRLAEPAVPCRVTFSCVAFLVVLCAAEAVLTPDANHTPPVDLQDYRTGKKMKVKHRAQ